MPGVKLKFAIRVANDQAWRTLVKEGSPDTLFVVDAFSSEWGVSEALHRKIHDVFMELPDLDMTYVEAEADGITQLLEQRHKSRPLILFFKNGKERARVAGAFPLEVERAIKRLALEKFDNASISASRRHLLAPSANRPAPVAAVASPTPKRHAEPSASRMPAFLGTGVPALRGSRGSSKAGSTSSATKRSSRGMLTGP